MKKSILIAAAFMALVACGCDPLGAPPQDPYAPPPKNSAAAPGAPRMSKRFLEEVFNYIVNRHGTMRNERDRLVQMSREHPDFQGYVGRMTANDEETRALLAVREEWLARGDYDESHPSRKLRLAIYHLNEESRHLDNVFLHGTPLDPKFAETTDNALREAAKAILNYQDPPGP